jgi:hypothetical protein
LSELRNGWEEIKSALFQFFVVAAAAAIVLLIGKFL